MPTLSSGPRSRIASATSIATRAKTSRWWAAARTRSVSMRAPDVSAIIVGAAYSRELLVTTRYRRLAAVSRSCEESVRRCVLRGFVGRQCAVFELEPFVWRVGIQRHELRAAGHLGLVDVQ